jgi:hypothetical protein
MRKIVFLGLALFLGNSLFGQLSTDADFKRQVYDRSYSAGLNLNTRGFALSGKYLKYVDGYSSQGFEIDLAKVRHPKEIISSEDIFNNYRGFVKGRINSFYTLRTGYTYEQVLFDKTDRGSISISWVASGGASFGLLKPIYLSVNEFGDDGDLRIETIRYTGETNPANINGEASYLTGILETNIKPGIYVKGGISFDYQLFDDDISTLETGIIYDYYFSEVPIFFEAQEDINWAGFFQLYLSVNFGYKRN